MTPALSPEEWAARKVEGLFTQEDVVNLKSHAIASTRHTGWGQPEEHWAHLLAARIEALLPPEAK